MTSINYFPVNDQDSKRYRDLMHDFYRYIVPGCKPHYMDGDSHFEQFVQRKLDIDLLLEDPRGVLDSYEEKIAGWPADSEPHTALCVETESNSNPGFITRGWIDTCQANNLIYVFEVTPLQLLDIYHINMPKFRKYFWQEYRKNPRRFSPFRNSERNKSQGILVGIGEVYKCIEGTKRYLLSFDGSCEEVDISITISSLLRKGA